MNASYWMCAIAFSISLSCAAGNCQGDTCFDEKAIADAIRTVRVQGNFEGALQASTDPTLTDDVVYLKQLESPIILGASVPVVSFYRVTPAHYELQGNKVVSQTVEVDTYREWLVAIDRHNDFTVILEGSSNPIAGFNKLVKDLRLLVNNTDAAVEVFDFFLKVAFGQRFRAQVLSDDIQLESIALEDFRSRLAASERRGAFETWWRNMNSDIKKALRPPKALAINGGYEIEYYVYDQGKVSDELLRMGTDGTVSKGESKVVYEGTATTHPLKPR